METVELIIKIALFILNVSTVAFIVIMISKWHKRMEDKLNSIQRYIHQPVKILEKGYALALCDVNGKRVYITCYDLEKKPFVSTNGEE